RKGLSEASEPSREADFFNEYGNSLNNLKKSDSALLIFDSAIHKYPAVSLLYLNKGTTLYVLNRHAEAEAVYKQTLLMNPYSYSAHFKLAMLSVEQGKLVPAILGFVGYLLMTPEGKYQGNCINMLKAIAHNEDEIQKYVNARKETPSDNYQLLEQIVQSKIALDQNYKPIIKLDDPICRQLQVVFEKMEYNEADNDFWNQYYIAYFKKVFTDGKFEPFINHIFSGVSLAPIKEYNKKNSKEINTLTSQAGDYFDLIRATRELNARKRSLDSVAWFYSKGKLVAKGRALNNGDKLVGPWEFMYETGNISGKGLYNSQGQKTGPFLYYHRDGSIRGKEFYRDGKQEDEETYYYSNGVMSSHSWYKNNELNGESISYFRDGIPHT
ncbi:MAG: hypothetical protein JST39_00060, partial [Bacteroidetes bacterium]|nr:hypothetical protein [Bacteroidota bacterium]